MQRCLLGAHRSAARTRRVCTPAHRASAATQPLRRLLLTKGCSKRKLAQRFCQPSHKLQVNPSPPKLTRLEAEVRRSLLAALLSTVFLRPLTALSQKQHQRVFLREFGERLVKGSLSVRKDLGTDGSVGPTTLAQLCRSLTASSGFPLQTFGEGRSGRRSHQRPPLFSELSSQQDPPKKMFLPRNSTKPCVQTLSLARLHLVLYS